MGWKIRIRDREGCVDPTPFLSPDLVLLNTVGTAIHFDHALAEADEVRNVKGLRSKAGLHTAVIIQLFTDRRIRDDQTPDDPFSPDPKGWWGDSVDVRPEAFETEIGSHLWLLRRSALTTEVVAQAREYAHEALLPIVQQGAVARFDIVAEAQSLSQGGHPATGVLGLGIDGYSQDGRRIYDQRFQVLWDQIRAMT